MNNAFDFIWLALAGLVVIALIGTILAHLWGLISKPGREDANLTLEKARTDLKEDKGKYATVLALGVLATIIAVVVATASS